MNYAIIEGLKQIARVSVLAAIPVLVNGLSTGAINWNLVATSAAIAALMGIDKWLHEKGKDEGNDEMAKGLTRF